METTRPKQTLGTTWTLVAILVLIALAWRGCWYATRLSDDELAAVLARGEPAAEVQKALLQIHDRLEGADESAAAHLPAVIGLVDCPTPQIRATAAWVLGTRPSDPSLAAPLARLLADEQKIVRFNAALALAGRGDASVRPVLLEMLQRDVVASPAAGRVESPRARGEAVKVGTVIARLETENGRLDLLSAIDGVVARRLRAHGDQVEAGTALIEIEPAMAQIANAAAALGKVGTREDAQVLKELVEGSRPINDDARRFAALAIKELLD